MNKTIAQTIADGLAAACDGRGFSAEHYKAVWLANAAPDLFDALREMTERYDALDRRLLNNQHAEPNGTISRARAALAKAEGK